MGPIPLLSLLQSRKTSSSPPRTSGVAAHTRLLLGVPTPPAAEAPLAGVAPVRGVVATARARLPIPPAPEIIEGVPACAQETPRPVTPRATHGPPGCKRVHAPTVGAPRRRAAALPIGAVKVPGPSSIESPQRPVLAAALPTTGLANLVAAPGIGATRARTRDAPATTASRAPKVRAATHEHVAATGAVGALPRRRPRP